MSLITKSIGIAPGGYKSAFKLPIIAIVIAVLSIFIIGRETNHFN